MTRAILRFAVMMLCLALAACAEVKMGERRAGSGGVYSRLSRDWRERERGGRERDG